MSRSHSNLKSYSELIRIEGFEDRYRYLELRGVVGDETFGSERFLNQKFYTSREWRDLRHFIISRDEGCDLAHRNFPIQRNLLIHHLNPLTVEQVLDRDPVLLDPENLITTQRRTHNAIHYGDESQLPRDFVPRMPGDTNLW
jgi:hypothetical protein